MKMYGRDVRNKMVGHSDGRFSINVNTNTNNAKERLIKHSPTVD